MKTNENPIVYNNCTFIDIEDIIIDNDLTDKKIKSVDDVKKQMIEHISTTLNFNIEIVERVVEAIEEYLNGLNNQEE